MDTYDIIASYVNGNINHACKEVYKYGAYDFFKEADMNRALYRRFTLAYLYYLENI